MSAYPTVEQVFAIAADHLGISVTAIFDGTRTPFMLRCRRAIALVLHDALTRSWTAVSVEMDVAPGTVKGWRRKMDEVDRKLAAGITEQLEAVTHA